MTYRIILTFTICWTLFGIGLMIKGGIDLRRDSQEFRQTCREDLHGAVLEDRYQYTCVSRDDRDVILKTRSK